MAGAIGGFNAHAANIVTAVFIATGQVIVCKLLSNIWIVSVFKLKASSWVCFIGPETPYELLIRLSAYWTISKLGWLTNQI